MAGYRHGDEKLREAIYVSDYEGLPLAWIKGAHDVDGQGVPWVICFNGTRDSFLWVVVFSYLTSMTLAGDVLGELVVLGVGELFPKLGQCFTGAKVCLSCEVEYLHGVSSGSFSHNDA